MTDIVFLYKADHRVNENELRYSIRSAVSNLKFNNLIVVGDRPSFLSDEAIHLPAEVKKGKIESKYLFKHIDMLEKARAIIQDKRIAKNIIWCNDDFYVMKEYNEFPYYYNGTIKDWYDSQNNWEKAGGKKSKTWNIYISELYKRFPKGKWYEVHCPIVFNKRKLAKVIKDCNLQHLGTIRSYYANYYGVKSEETKDYKIYTINNFKKYKTAPFISTTNIMGRFSPVIDFLKTKFPNKTIYEK